MAREYNLNGTWVCGRCDRRPDISVEDQRHAFEARVCGGCGRQVRAGIWRERPGTEVMAAAIAEKEPTMPEPYTHMVAAGDRTWAFYLDVAGLITSLKYSDDLTTSNVENFVTPLQVLAVAQTQGGDLVPLVAAGTGIVDARDRPGFLALGHNAFDVIDAHGARVREMVAMGQNLRDMAEAITGGG